MDKKISVLTIIVEKGEAVERVNGLLHDYREDIIGRFGLPVKERGVSVITVVMDSMPEIVNSLSGKLGMIDGVKSKVLTAK